jgi:hypothetical protein
MDFTSAREVEKVGFSIHLFKVRFFCVSIKRFRPKAFGKLPAAMRLLPGSRPVFPPGLILFFCNKDLKLMVS